jgi:hypothetical protein
LTKSAADSGMSWWLPRRATRGNVPPTTPDQAHAHYGAPTSPWASRGWRGGPRPRPRPGLAWLSSPARSSTRRYKHHD